MSIDPEIQSGYRCLKFEGFYMPVDAETTSYAIQMAHDAYHLYDRPELTIVLKRLIFDHLNANTRSLREAERIYLMTLTELYLTTFADYANPSKIESEIDEVST